MSTSLSRLIAESATPSHPLQSASTSSIQTQVSIPDPPSISHLNLNPIIKLSQPHKHLTLVNGFLRGLNPKLSVDELDDDDHRIHSPAAKLRASTLGLAPDLHLSQVPPPISQPPGRLYLTPTGEIAREVGQSLSKDTILTESGSLSRTRTWIRSRSITPLGLSPISSRRTLPGSMSDGMKVPEDDHTQAEYRALAEALLRVGQSASDRRGGGGDGSRRERRRWVDEEVGESPTRSDRRRWNPFKPLRSTSQNHQGMLWLLQQISNSLNSKLRISIGILISLMGGAMTPVFSVLLSQLLSQLAHPPQGMILKHSILISLVAIVDGLLAFGRIWIMEGVGTIWLQDMRLKGMKKMILKDLTWFQASQNQSPQILHRLIKDGNEARELVSQILADLLTIFTLLIVAFVWAMGVGWELTLVGLSLAPVFFFVIGGGGKILSRLEIQNKLWRESVSMEFYLVCHFSLSL